MKWNSRLYISPLFLFFSLQTFADTNDAGAKVAWGYTGAKGPAYWGELDPSFKACAAGKSQSPINIIKRVQSINYPLVINYQAAPFLIIEDGTTDLMIGDTQTIINDGHAVQLNFPSDSVNETITFNDKTYRLVQFHFHSPSENTWHGQTFPLEIHFVHQGENGSLAVIGVFVRGGKENQTIQKIVNNLPKEEKKLIPVQGETINPANLLPAKKEYYEFQGSLTTPPCSEGVAWLLMGQPIEASPGQIMSLREAMGGTNARPIQSLNDRKIGFNQASK